jgi:serine/alanine adding enzyme
MRIRLFREGDRERWDAYIKGSDKSSCYHLIGWKNVIERSFGHKTYYLLSENNSNTINGILPMVHLKSVLFGNFMVALPYFNYGGVCAEKKEVVDRLLKEAVRIAREKECRHIELRQTQYVCDELPIRTNKVSMRINLPKDPDLLWNSFSSKLRSQIRRASKEGMYAKVGREEELNSFYKVFSVNMRDLGTPVYSRDFFANILEEYPETLLCTVYTKDGLGVAAGFLVGYRHLMQIPWASSLREYNRYGSNMLLYWSALKIACEENYRVFDFGRSTVGGGTYRFKEQWGARPIQLYWHYWLKSGGPLPELNPNNAKYQTAIKIWRKLPVVVSKIVGPHIVKNIP